MREINKIIKEPGSKLIRVNCVVENGNIKSIKISGDFFAYPEETISGIESALVGARAVPGEVEKIAETICRKLNAELYGISPALIAKAFEGETQWQ